MAAEKPHFILRGMRRFAEVTLPWAILGVGLGIFVTKLNFLAAPAAGLTLADAAITSFISKSRIPQAAQ